MVQSLKYGLNYPPLTDIFTQYQSHYRIHIENTELEFMRNINGINVLSLFDEAKILSFLENSTIQIETGRRLIFSTIASKAYVKTLEKCLSSAIYHGVEKKQIMIFALDEETIQFCQSIDIFCVRMNYETIFKHSWFIVGHLKQAIQYYIACHNCDLLFFDSDIAFLNNFKSNLLSHPSCDIQITDECKEPRKEINVAKLNIYNIGFMYVKPTRSTRALFRKWMKREYGVERLWDQGIFNQEMISQCRIIARDQNEKSVTYQFYYENETYTMKFHIVDPVKYINYCSLIHNKHGTSFIPDKFQRLMQFAREKNVSKPSFVHFACVQGQHKFNIMEKIEYTDANYDYLFKLFSNFEWMPYKDD
ncbi:hypothetical protein TRFO_29299 [Tritrichomonas foetus]|uniref:Nucleotide-diphospho-sugar transferase domain-containing protein n=1 Tax=Tritrichomonas foetus TaxID=1144522 RepID=A0A1J4JXD2_9EUKA|nr:hypothetical protein TRFO_29299 [Tritrichomonas foetus]|eukprot:OHT03322.1 hypothetical protein TRFO_29299 [Tritrichomonas foetus]